VQECRSAGVQECRSAGVQECRSAGVQECRSAGIRSQESGARSQELGVRSRETVGAKLRVSDAGGKRLVAGTLGSPAIRAQPYNRRDPAGLSAPVTFTSWERSGKAATPAIRQNLLHSQNE